MRWVGVFCQALLLALSSILSLPAPALAAGDAITGTVSGPSGPLAGVSVGVWSCVVDASKVPIGSCAIYETDTTASDGTYTTTQLPFGPYTNGIPNEYFLNFSKIGYNSAKYNNAQGQWAAVARGSTGINVTLTVQNDAIRGTVTGASGPLAGASVQVLNCIVDANKVFIGTCDPYETDSTIADGTYVTSQLPFPGYYNQIPREYALFFSATGYISTWYSTDLNRVQTAVARGSVNVDITLAVQDDAIHGTVSGPTGPLAGVSVGVWNCPVNANKIVIGQCALYETDTTGSNGVYNTTQLPLGPYTNQILNEYFLQFSKSGYDTLQYSNAQGQWLAVARGSTVNVTLAVQNDRIRGTVRDGFGLLAGASVDVFSCVVNANKVPIGNCALYETDTTGSDGTYMTSQLPFGPYTNGIANEYFLRFRGPTHVPEIYNNKASLSTGDAVARGSSGIDATLVSSKGTVRGRVTNSAGTGIAGVRVQFFFSAFNNSEYTTFTPILTDANGDYSFLIDASGTYFGGGLYRIRFSDPAGLYLTEYYDDRADLASGDIITVDPEATVVANAVLAISPTRIAIGNVSASEGNSGTKSFAFPVTLNAPAAAQVTVGFATVDGTATAGSDYAAASGTLTYLPGETSKTITVTVNGDTAFEPNETFTVQLSNPANATVLAGGGTGTIVNDDVIPALSIDDVSKIEGDGTTQVFTFTVTLTPASAGTVQVQAKTADGTANRVDYLSTFVNLSFAPGETQKTVTVYVIGDSTREMDETFFVDLIDPVGTVTIAKAYGTGTILNDDQGAPVLAIADASAAEGNAGGTPLVFTVHLSAPISTAVTVDYALSEFPPFGAKAGTDFTALPPGTLTFAPGETDKTITVSVIGDTVGEPDELFGITLSNPSANTGVETGTAQGKIVNDDTVVPRIGGTVRDATGPLAGVTVSFYACGSSSFFGCTLSQISATTGANGAYESGDLPTQGISGYQVGFSKAHYITQFFSPVAGGAPGQFQAALVPVPATGVDATLVWLDLTISGTVRNANGPLAGVAVSFYGCESQSSFPPCTLSSISATTDSTGHYTSGDLPSQGLVGYKVGFSKTLYVPQFYSPVVGGAPFLSFAAIVPIGTAGIDATLVSNAPTITLSPLTLPSGSAGVPYSQTITATGGAAPYSFTITAGTLPTGLTLNSGTGALSGTPSATGNFVFTVTATDVNGATGLQPYQLAVVCAPIFLSPSALPFGTAGVPYSQTLTGTGGTGPYTFRTAGNLPTGLVFNTSTGVLSGTPDPGTFTFEVTATDANGCYGSQIYSIVFALPTLTLSPTTLPNGVVGAPYSQTITASGGTGPYSVTITSGTLPTGLTLGSGSGLISGNPTTPGSFDFTVAATDVNTATGSRSYSVQITCATITLSPNTLANGRQGTAYSQTLTASGGVGPYSFSVTSGNLPNGLTLDGSSGLLSGSPDAGLFTFTVRATEANGCSGSQSYALTVLALPAISIDDVSVTEKDAGAFTSATFTVSLNAPSDQIVGVDYTTSDGTAKGGAVAGADYITNAGKLIFPPGITTQTVVVVVIGDIFTERDEKFFVNVANPANATIAKSVGVGTIIDNDGVPTISINDVTVIEGNTGLVSAIFSVALSNPSVDTVTVDFATTDATAHAGSDYVAISGTVSFAPGTTTQTITVLVNGDIFNEPDEIFSVDLSDPTNATVSDPQGIGTIANDDPLPLLRIEDISAPEGTATPGSATLQVHLSAPSGQTIVVNFVTVDDTAKDGNGEPASDYVASSGTLVFNPGETTQTINITLENDTLNEDDETFFVDLRNPTNASLDRGRAVVTIVDDDNQPMLSIDDRSVLEGDLGSTSLTFTVTLSAASGKTVTVDYATIDDSAKAGSDYVAAVGKLTLAPGETSKNLTVLVNGDVLSEPDENFFVNLSNPLNAGLKDAQGVASIINDDLPTYSIPDVAMKEGDDVHDMLFEVRLSNPVSWQVAIDWETADVTARAGSDYVAARGRIVFEPGETLKYITVVVLGDRLNEDDDIWTISTSSFDALSDRDEIEDPPTGTVYNDDPAPSVSITGAVSVTEGNSGTTDATFTVTLSTASGLTVVVDYETAQGGTNPALAGSDYVATTGTLTFAPGTTTQTLTVAVNGDLIKEQDETFVVDLRRLVNATIGAGQGTATILNDDGAPIELQLRTLIDLVRSFDLSKGRETSLLAKLRLECGPLGAFGNEVEAQNGKDLSPAQAGQLLAGDAQLLVDLGCVTTSAPTIIDFTPTSGTPGAQVTITGINFTGVTAVKFGAVSATFTLVSDGEIRATVPATASTGAISVTTAQGTATTGTRLFTVIKPPTIALFTPLQGTVGTLVTINGTNLGSATEVKFNGLSAGSPTIVTATQIRATVPAGATTGKISVTNTSGTAMSAADFKVLPKIDSFAPLSGTVGATVTITGTNLKVGSTDPTVRIGAVIAPVTSASSDTVVATIPATAITGKISVTTVDGTGVSATDLTVIKPPTIASFTPLSGPVGTLVTINGTNLSSVTDVKFNGVSASPITPVSATSIKVNVPLGATTGKVAVTNPAGSALSAGTFKVLPKIDSFTPVSGTAGTNVTITGTNFGGLASVKFGTVVAAVVSATDTTIVATVPATAITSKISVTTADGTGISVLDFVVIRPPTIALFTPASGVVGTVVTINGTNLSSVTEVFFDGTSAGAPMVMSTTQIRATVPAGATTGRISVTNAAGTAQSVANFTVLP